MANSTVLLCEVCSSSQKHVQTNLTGVFICPKCNVNTLIHSSANLVQDKNQQVPINLITWTKSLSGRQRKYWIPPPEWWIHEVLSPSHAKRLTRHCDGWHGHVYLTLAFFKHWRGSGVPLLLTNSISTQRVKPVFFLSIVGEELQDTKPHYQLS